MHYACLLARLQQNRLDRLSYNIRQWGGVGVLSHELFLYHFAKLVQGKRNGGRPQFRIGATSRRAL